MTKKRRTDKSAIARKTNGLCIKDLKRQEALEKVRKQEWTIWKAANYCKQSYRSFLRLLREKTIPFPISVEELEREFNASRTK